jgi:hypothetical protein
MKMNTNAEEALRQAREACASAQPGQTVGDLLWYDFKSGFIDDCMVVRQAWRECGLDPSADLPSEPGMEAAFCRAVDAIKRQAGKDYVINDNSPVGAKTKCICVMRVDRNETTKRNTAYTVGVVVLEQCGVVNVKESDPAGFASGIAHATQKYVDHYTTADIRSAITRVLARWQATPCRQSPPHIVYWMPSPGGETVRRLRDALNKLGAGKLHLSPMGRDIDSQEAASAAANDGLESRLSEFREQVDAWRNEPPGRKLTIERRIEEAEKIRETANLYRAILGAAVADVDERVASVQSSLRELLGVMP